MSDKATYLYYPGHLGPRPVTELTAERGILWDAPVKRVPAAFAASLVADGGFRLALAESEAAQLLSRSKKRLREFVPGRLDGETYHPPRDGEPDVPVTVLPAGLTPAALKARLDAEDAAANPRKEDGDA